MLKVQLFKLLLRSNPIIAKYVTHISVFANG